MIKRRNAEIKCVFIEPMGARILYDGLRTSYSSDLLISLGGVAWGSAAALLGASVFALIKNEYVLLFVLTNIALSAVNLLPIASLDGGKAINAYLCNLYGTECAGAEGRVLDAISKLLLLTANAFALVKTGFNTGFCILLILQIVSLMSY